MCCQRGSDHDEEHQVGNGEQASWDRRDDQHQADRHLVLCLIFIGSRLGGQHLLDLGEAPAMSGREYAGGWRLATLSADSSSTTVRARSQNLITLAPGSAAFEVVGEVRRAEVGDGPGE